MKISVSFIKSKYKEKETIKLIDKTNADYLHVDIMDGKFVDAKNYSFKQIEELVKYTTKKSKNEKVIDAENQTAALVKTVEELSNNFGNLSEYKIIIKPLKEK